jgi:hypothetical protein
LFFPCFFLLLLSLSQRQLLLGFGSVFDCHTDEGVGGCTFNIFDVEGTEILFLASGRSKWVVIYDGFLCNG